MKITKSQLKQIIKEELNEITAITESSEEYSVGDKLEIFIAGGGSDYDAPIISNISQGSQAGQHSSRFPDEDTILHVIVMKTNKPVEG